MKLVIQRCASARVEVGGEIVGEIGRGLTVFIGIARGDDEACAAKLAAKIVGLRVFEKDGRLDLSVRDLGGAVLVVPNFSVLGDARKGTRPSFSQAALPDDANRLYQAFVRLLREQNIEVATGQFGASMRVWVENDGPLTLLLEAIPDTK